MVDVGAAGGLDNRWEEIKKYCRFITFEADARSQDMKGALNFNMGLGDVRENRKLYSTKFPPASSVFPLNESDMKGFANWDLHEVIGDSEIELDTLSAVLEEHSEVLPCFIKTDVEDMDFAVLKGAEKYIETTTLGVQIETSIVQRHLGAPTFPVIHEWMVGHGYQLQILARERWLKANKVWGINSNPQIVWADALYLIKKERLLEQLSNIDKQAREVMVGQFILICLTYRVHDYAIDVIHALGSSNLIEESFANSCRSSVMSSLDKGASKVLIGLFGVLLGIVGLAVTLIFWPKRKSAQEFFRRRVLDVSHSLYQWSSKAGHESASLSDFFG